MNALEAWIDETLQILKKSKDDRNCVKIAVSSKEQVEALKNMVKSQKYFIECWSKDEKGQRYAIIDTHSIFIPFDAFD